MSKEYLEAFERIKELPDSYRKQDVWEHCYMVDCEKIEQALHRLEAIDNANPSEALKCLEEWYGFLMADNDTTYSNGYENEIEYNRRKEAIYKQYYIIKQALLKAQEPKQYLKWEDLEFKKERQEIPVRMGENIYILVLRKTDGSNKIAKLLSPKRNYMGEWGDIFYEEAKQFFNDLHLERVEE